MIIPNEFPEFYRYLLNELRLHFAIFAQSLVYYIIFVFHLHTQLLHKARSWILDQSYHLTNKRSMIASSVLSCDFVDQMQ